MEAEPPKADLPKRNRRWFQFSLRTLLVFTVVIAVVCGLLGRKIELKRRERAAAEAIVKKQGQVSWDYERVAGDPHSWQPAGAVPFGPSWLRAILGDNFFSEVDCIYCFSDLENLRAFPRLRSLRLVGWGVTDDGLEAVKTLTELHDLVFIDTKVSDAAVNDLHLALPKCYISVIHQGADSSGPPASHKDFPPINAAK